MTTNKNIPTDNLSNAAQRPQRGSTVIEFPFVVLAFMILLWGFVAAYRLFYMQIQLDNVTNSLANAISKTESKTNKDTPYLSRDLAEPLLILANRYLPDSIKKKQYRHHPRKFSF